MVHTIIVTVLHDISCQYKGFATSNAGGRYMRADILILTELLWAKQSLFFDLWFEASF